MKQLSEDQEKILRLEEKNYPAHNPSPKDSVDDLPNNNKNNQNQPRLSSFGLRSSIVNNLTSLVRKQFKDVAELEFIKQQLFEMKFFQQFFKGITDSNIIQKLCSNICIERFNTLDIIIRQGDESNDKLYVLVSGKAVVCVANFQNQNTKVLKNQILAQHIEQKYQKRFLMLFKIYGDPVYMYNYGEGFGELALLAKNKADAKRSATIIALENMEVLVLDKQNYLDSLEFTKESNNKQSIFNILIQFFIEYINHCFPFVNDFTSLHHKQFFYMNIAEKTMLKDYIVCKEGYKGKNIFVIISGEMNLLKQLTIEQQYLNQKYKLKLFEINKNQYFGEEILFSAKPIYEYTVKVSSVEATYLSIPISLMQQKFPPEFILNLKNNMVLKKQVRNSRIEDFLMKHYSSLKKQKTEQLETGVSLLAERNKPLIGKMRPQLLNQIVNAQTIQTNQDAQLADNGTFIKEQNNDEKITHKLSNEVKTKYLKQKKQKQILQFKAGLHRQELRNDSGQDRQNFSDLLAMLSQRKNSIDQESFQRLLGTEESLINSQLTNRFFCVNKIKNSAQKDRTLNNLARTVELEQHRDDIGVQTDQETDLLTRDAEKLDLGYMKSFVKNKDFKLIQMGIVKKFKDKRTFFEELQKSEGKIYHKIPKYIDSKPLLSSELQIRKNLYYQNSKDKSVDSEQHNSQNNLIYDPYQVTPSRESSEKRKTINRKQRRINIINRRIINKYKTLESEPE